MVVVTVKTTILVLRDISTGSMTTKEFWEKTMGVYENARNATRKKIIGCFWELYKEKPIEKIVIKEITYKCNIGRGTFYNHFQDVYDVLNAIEVKLSYDLSSMCAEIRSENSSIDDFSRVLYKYYGNEETRDYINVLVLDHRDSFFAENYLEILHGLLIDVCLEDIKNVTDEKEKMIVDVAIDSLINMLLNCICKSSLTIKETNSLIAGIIQNGIYVTLTGRFGIRALKNPFVR